MRFLRDALLTVAILIVVVMAVLFLSLGDLFSAGRPAGALESSIALRLRNLAIPAGAKGMSSPFEGRKNVWREGADHFTDHCAVCHGRDGRGGGEIGPRMSPRVPDMTLPRTQNLTDGELFYIISNGVRWTGMPAWKGEHTDEETWHLVAFIRHLPSMTREELHEIEKAGGDQHHEGKHE